jgi:hypothetical protein
MHRQWGKVDFWAMAGIAVPALILSFALPVLFLAMVAAFSLYSAFAAYRILYLKGLFKGARPKAAVWLAAVVTVLSSFLCSSAPSKPPGLEIAHEYTSTRTPEKSGVISREKLLLAAASAKPGKFSKGIPNVEARAVALADPELAEAIAPDTCVLSAKGPRFAA